MPKQLDKYEVQNRFARIPGISGDMIELVMDLMDDEVGADYDAGTLIRISQGFKAVGSHLESKSKDIQMTRLQGGRGDAASEVVGDVLFKFDPGFYKPLGGVDTAAVKKFYPAEEFPELYKDTSRAPQIQVQA